jgi:hypothetical protein
MCLRARDHATINRHMWKRVQVRGGVNPRVPFAVVQWLRTDVMCGVCPTGVVQGRAPGHSARVRSDERCVGWCTMAGASIITLSNVS